MIITIELPKIYSYYQYLSHNKYRKYITKKGREYKYQIEDILIGHMENIEIFKGDVKLDIKLYFNTKHKHDIDNYTKPLMDFMSDIIYLDDRQVIDLRVRKFYEKVDNCKIVIDIEEI